MVGHDIVISWVLYALRTTMGLDDVRRIILRHEIDNNRVVQIGRTFGADNSEADLLAYLHTIVAPRNKKRYLLFTALNIPDADMQTHYQAFVVDYKMKALHMIDPARRARGQQGIYAAYISEDTIAPFFRSHGYSTEWVRTSHPCQTDPDDVFCQTWSLMLQIRLVNRLIASSSEEIIPVPASRIGRYRVLTEFYRHCVSDINGVCEDLATEYRNIIRHNPDIYGQNTSKKARRMIRSFLLNVDACETVQTMTAEDLLP